MTCYIGEVVKSPRLLLAFFLLLVALIALGGQVRAAEAASAGGSDGISSSAGDDTILAGRRPLLFPPHVSYRALPLPIENGFGRMVIADLFRPPIQT
jgi:hypothetical protein